MAEGILQPPGVVGFIPSEEGEAVVLLVRRADSDFKDVFRVVVFRCVGSGQKCPELFFVPIRTCSPKSASGGFGAAEKQA